MHKKLRLYKVRFDPNKSLDVTEATNLGQHYDSFRPTLAEITQTPAQQKQFISDVLHATVQKKTVTSEIILGNLTFPPQESVLVRQQVVSFVDANLVEISKLPAPSVTVWKKFSVDVGSLHHPALFNDLIDKGKNLATRVDDLLDVPGYRELLTSLSMGLGKAALPVIYSLREYSAVNEFLVCLSFDQTIATYVGTVAFVKVFYVLKQKGNFIALLDGVNQYILLDNAKPFRHVVTNLVYEQRMFIYSSMVFGTVALLKGNPSPLADTVINFHVHLFDIAPNIRGNVIVSKFLYQILKSSGSAAKTFVTTAFQGFVNEVQKDYALFIKGLNEK